MKTLRARPGANAFTLIEVLVVIFIIGFVAIVMLPPGHGGKQKAMTVACMNNQKQIVLGCLIWSQDHTDAGFPWQLPSTNGGTAELVEGGDVVPQFQALSGIIKNPQVYKCPADRARVYPAYDSDGTLTRSNVSYFINADAQARGTTPSLTILTGDRHLRSGKTPVAAGLFVYTNGMTMGWTSELHRSGQNFRGVLSFADGHSEVVSDKDLAPLFENQDLPRARLLVP